MISGYHFSCNGAVERQHRSLKTALKAKCENNNWLINLPLVLLGLKNSISSHSGTSSSIATYGKNLNMPCVVFDNMLEFNNELKYQTPVANITDSFNSYVPKDFRTCKFVLYRKLGILKSLEQPYSGPYRVLDRNFINDTMLLNIHNCNKWISLSNLKPSTYHVRFSI